MYQDLGGKSYLSVSNAGACTGLESEAPQGLSPDLVMYATLVSQGPNGQYVFIVEQSVPDGLEVKGRFIGGDGYFALEFSGASVSLKGAARFKPGPRTSAASPHCVLLGENAPGATVHFSAEYVPWQDEMLPRGFEGESVCATY
ncbi:hypothetical protein [Roseovarius rhodophyticola]|uniref:Uncharacterized protein n=1 Tax=Roseovarius rhodophyticola TaxID=3080827 RepID=A0ABZ2TFZ4_9RHOB|nr:hypothetical protein [Roseovarius sp. W115]